jgi:hypothetical protein
VTERRSPRTDRPVRTAALLRRTLSDTAHLHGAAWWRLALVVFCTGLAMVVVVEVLLQLAGPVVRLLAPLVVTNGVLDPLGAVLLSLVAGVLFLVTCLPVVALGVATVVRLVDDRLAGGRLGVRAALRVVLPRLRAVTGLVLVSTVAVLVLAAVSPVLVVVGVLGLVLTPLVRLLGQRWVPAQRWPGVRVLGWLAVPFVLALRLLGSALLGVPAAVLDAPTVGAALRRADGTARGHRVLVVVLGGASLLVAVALQSATTFVGQLAGGQVGLVLGTVAGQLLFLALPAVVLTVLYRLAGAGDADGRLDPDLTVPYGATASAPTDRERATGLLVVATTYRRRLGAVLTASLVAGLLVPGVAQAQTETGGGAASTPSGSATLTVTSGADSVDPAVVATSASSCTSGAGECTLRGALAAASGLAAAGTVGAITVGFATDTTVAAVPGSRLTFSDGSGGSGGGEGAGTSGRLTLDGGGHRVVVDGAGLDLFSNGWNVTVRALEVTGAVGGAASGGIGGGFYVSGAGDSVLDGVTVDHSTATAGGGVYSYRGLRIVNSTFSDNVATAAPSDSTEGGGADVYSGGGSTTIESSSFAGSRGGAVFTGGFGSGRRGWLRLRRGPHQRLRQRRPGCVAVHRHHLRHHCAGGPAGVHRPGGGARAAPARHRHGQPRAGGSRQRLPEHRRPWGGPARRAVRRRRVPARPGHGRRPDLEPQPRRRRRPGHRHRGRDVGGAGGRVRGQRAAAPGRCGLRHPGAAGSGWCRLLPARRSARG